MSKFCSNCGKENGDNVGFCAGCGANLNGGAPVQPVQKKKGLPAWAIVLIVLGVIFLLFGGCCAAIVGMASKTVEEISNEITTSYRYTESSSSNKKTYGFNETFKFDGFEITLGNNYTFTSIDNKYSDNYGKPVVKLPVAIKNTNSDTKKLNMFYYDVYGSAGTKTSVVDTYFDSKTSLQYGGDLRSGASATLYLYFIYDGDGTYAIEFDNFSEEVTAEFSIKK